jgi:HAD superfamily hydrolase (TIGR01450 family)
MRDLNSIKLYMLDMDGTIYNEDTLIQGASEFFNLLNEQGKDYVFMTNNSSKGKRSYVEKLNRLGIKATERNICSSVNATVMYLNKHKPKAKLYVLGTESLKKELIEEGFDIVPVNYRETDIDYVLLGFDTELNYEKIRGACYYVSRDYPYIATNCDLKCPVLGNKFIPDCGAIAKMIELSTNRLPLFLGKPERTMVDAVSKEWNMPISKIACVGDRLYTDIAVGINAGATSICVLTGEATEQEIATSQIKPDYVFTSIKDLYLALR